MVTYMPDLYVYLTICLFGLIFGGYVGLAIGVGFSFVIYVAQMFNR